MLLCCCGALTAAPCCPEAPLYLTSSPLWLFAVVTKTLADVGHRVDYVALLQNLLVPGASPRQRRLALEGKKARFRPLLRAAAASGGAVPLIWLNWLNGLNWLCYTGSTVLFCFQLDRRYCARQCLIIRGLLPMLAAPGTGGDEVRQEIHVMWWILPVCRCVRACVRGGDIQNPCLLGAAVVGCLAACS